MPGSNLTREEARDRAALLTVESYEIDLDLTTGDATFASTTTVRFRAEKGAEHLAGPDRPAVEEVVLNGKKLDAPALFDGNRIRLDGLRAQNEVRVVAETSMNTGELAPVRRPCRRRGLPLQPVRGRRRSARFACFEQPDLKATFAFTVTAPAHWQVVSNSPTPEPADVDDRQDVKRWEFDATPRISTYVTALVAGPYHVVRDEFAGKEATVPLGLFCRASLAEHLDAEELFDVTRRGFGFFEDVFGLAYPFAKFDQLFVPEFNSGAMENGGCHPPRGLRLPQPSHRRRP